MQMFQILNILNKIAIKRKTINGAIFASKFSINPVNKNDQITSNKKKQSC